MAQEKLSRDEKLNERCDVLAKVVLRLRPVYQEPATKHQKPAAKKTQMDLLEILIGAAIWYLPECEGQFTGRISIKAAKDCLQDPKAKVTKEHRYPRKQAGADLLKDKATKLTGKEVLAVYRRKWGRYNLVTKEENYALRPHQRKKGKSTNACYRAVGIILKVVPEELKDDRRIYRKRA